MVDYDAIRARNEKKYGTDIGRIGKMLLADRYDEKTHFLYELLQNAEDALRRRGDWEGSRRVQFDLSEYGLRVSHCGQPFDERDVEGVCGIGESTKGLTEIGRFGIGFKSVYALTERPEVHSGDDAFAIETYVLPVGVTPLARERDETVIYLPLGAEDSSDYALIEEGLRGIKSSTLLFLRQIEAIGWRAGNHSAHYVRQTEPVNKWIRMVTLISDVTEEGEQEERWLVFARSVVTGDGQPAGHVEIAFRYDGSLEKIKPVELSELVVFFPTRISTDLGYLMQGPFRTTPSRDNVPFYDSWNQHLLKESGTLLVEALRWLRDKRLLTVDVLRCLPTEVGVYPKWWNLRAIYERVKNALLGEALLPTDQGGYVAAAQALLGRSGELRSLFDGAMAGALFERSNAAWLSGEITENRTPLLRQYLMEELKVPEADPEAVVRRLTSQFLEAQSDDWIVRLYEYLNGLVYYSIRHLCSRRPLVRLESGQHVTAQEDGNVRAYLPSSLGQTGLPTVRAAVCSTKEARAFLQAMGVNAPDLVDVVLKDVLPKYVAHPVTVTDEEYADDIGRIVAAYGTDSYSQRHQLMEALRAATFVRAVDNREGGEFFATPDALYLVDNPVVELMAGVKGILVVDEGQACLQGEDIRSLLTACGLRQTLHVEKVSERAGASRFTWAELQRMREESGYERTTYRKDTVTDIISFQGLDGLVALLPELTVEERRQRAALLWKELLRLYERDGKAAFAGRYTWSHYTDKYAEFTSTVIQRLNDEAWVPDEQGDLRRPGDVPFRTLGWAAHDYLEKQIRFLPPVDLEKHAAELGLDKASIELMLEAQRRGMTPEEMKRRLGLGEEKPRNAPARVPAVSHTPTGVYAEMTDLFEEEGGQAAHDVSSPGRPSVIGEGRPGRPEQSTARSAEPGSSRSGTGGVQPSRETARAESSTQATASSRGSQERKFVSYIEVQAAADREQEHGGAMYADHMDLERRAIALILAQEPALRRTSTHQPGYDLYEEDEGGTVTRYVEVKAMSAGMQDQATTMSHTQFEMAQQLGEAYWLYVVEHAGTDAARVVKIHNPAGRASRFAFDAGWLAVAEVQEADVRGQGDIRRWGMAQ